MRSDFDLEVNGVKRNLCNYVLNGIYPIWSIFIDTKASETTRRHLTFISAQKASKKDAERTFAVLQARWHILARPCNYRDKEICQKVIKVFIALHNMVVVHRRDGYNSMLFEQGQRAVESGIFTKKKSRRGEE